MLEARAPKLDFMEKFSKKTNATTIIKPTKKEERP
jgi:hypothetical protein